VLPRHAWLPGGWLDAIPEGTEAEQPAWYARSLVERLRDAGQEVGSHSFTHPIFGDKGCDHEAADGDLSRCVAEARRLGIELRSFVFPRNVAGHQDLLARHGFRCWRALEPAWYRRAGVPVPVARLAHLAEAAAGARPPTVMPWRDEHGLVVIPASASILPVDGVRRLIPVRQRVRRVRRGIDAAAAEGRICHVYTHPINLASAPDALLGAMRAMVEHACRLRDAGRLEILPMAEIAERVLDV
jgi:peptidoglycan/xylan/chitin deacetylase (PgdA/CDA1 family)